MKYEGILTEKGEFLSPDSPLADIPETLHVEITANGKLRIQLLFQTESQNVQMKEGSYRCRLAVRADGVRIPKEYLLADELVPQRGNLQISSGKRVERRIPADVSKICTGDAKYASKCIFTL